MTLGKRIASILADEEAGMAWKVVAVVQLHTLFDEGELHKAAATEEHMCQMLGCQA